MKNQKKWTFYSRAIERKRLNYVVQAAPTRECDCDSREWERREYRSDDRNRYFSSRDIITGRSRALNYDGAASLDGEPASHRNRRNKDEEEGKRRKIKKKGGKSRAIITFDPLCYPPTHKSGILILPSLRLRNWLINQESRSTPYRERADERDATRDSSPGHRVNTTANARTWIYDGDKFSLCILARTDRRVAIRRQFVEIRGKDTRSIGRYNERVDCRCEKKIDRKKMILKSREKKLKKLQIKKIIRKMRRLWYYINALTFWKYFC